MHSYGDDKIIDGSGTGRIDLRTLTPAKAAHDVNEKLELLNVGRTPLSAAVKRGELNQIHFGKKTCVTTTDPAAFLTRLRGRPSSLAPLLRGFLSSHNITSRYTKATVFAHD